MRGFKAYVGMRVVVAAADFHVKGTLVSVHRDVLVLREAMSITEHGNTPIDGALLVPAAVVQYVQVP